MLWESHSRASIKPRSLRGSQAGKASRAPQGASPVEAEATTLETCFTIVYHGNDAGCREMRRPRRATSIMLQEWNGVGLCAS